VVGVAWQRLPVTTALTPTVWTMLGIVALAVVPLTTRTGGHRAQLVGRALAVQVIYLVLHELSGRLVPHGAEAPIGLLVFTGAAFVGLFAVQSACIVAADSRLVQRIRPWIYAGLFLDDAFTRAAFTVSPPPAATARPAPLPSPSVTTVVRVGATLEVAT
jgi:NAD(P)H-quinone oxidoreductase subunit 5